MGKPWTTIGKSALNGLLKVKINCSNGGFLLPDLPHLPWFPNLATAAVAAKVEDALAKDHLVLKRSWRPIHGRATNMDIIWIAWKKIDGNPWKVASYAYRNIWKYLRVIPLLSSTEDQNIIEVPQRWA